MERVDFLFDQLFSVDIKDSIDIRKELITICDNWSNVRELQKTVKYLEGNYPNNLNKEYLKFNYDAGELVIITSASSDFFDLHLINLISSIHLNCLNTVKKIIVYDIGLTDEQVIFLNTLLKVEVREVPYSISNYGIAWWNWKMWSIHDFYYDSHDCKFLYVDAGVTICDDLINICNAIEKNGYLFFYGGPHKNNELTTKYVYDKLNIDMLTDSTIQLSANIIGFTKSNMNKNIIDDFYNIIEDERMFLRDGIVKRNLHDQSVLTLLTVKKHNLYINNALPLTYWAPIDNISIHQSRGICFSNYKNYLLYKG